VRLYEPFAAHLPSHRYRCRVLVALIDKVSASICMEEASRGRGRCERGVESESQHTVVADSFSEIKGGSALTKRVPRNDKAYRISAIKSSMAYHAMGEYETPLHHPTRSGEPTKACACKWSVTGILLSLNGGVKKPMRKLLAWFCKASD